MVGLAKGLSGEFETISWIEYSIAEGFLGSSQQNCLNRSEHPSQPALDYANVVTPLINLTVHLLL